MRCVSVRTVFAMKRTKEEIFPVERNWHPEKGSFEAYLKSLYSYGLEHGLICNSNVSVKVVK